MGSVTVIVLGIAAIVDEVVAFDKLGFSQIGNY
jgi:hypothetical protein